MYQEVLLRDAHRHSLSNKAELKLSQACGCFHCLRTFFPDEIEFWVNDGLPTALCPFCGIDSVLGEASGYPIKDQAFLLAMHEIWFKPIAESADGDQTMLFPGVHKSAESYQAEMQRYEVGPPYDWSLEDLAAIQEGFDQLDRGEGVSQIIVEQEIADLLRS